MRAPLICRAPLTFTVDKVVRSICGTSLQGSGMFLSMRTERLAHLLLIDFILFVGVFVVAEK
ncbi:expressed unknown protein [Ectocarpus siliculosus]|uniref:Uncharacterized protein n=1 Tax=Ectocarpus siliculosus TaxID=2880 RepID=D8LPZ8_ECTSI|nr:expressed unknown protein [Ectocarpus siliculosus]|eukprot:CBN74890.1 expressed unknown protein [Ectocarpus siliculosus]